MPFFKKISKYLRKGEKVNTNTEPFPEDTFERLNANEIWDNILDYLSDPTDVKSASLTCGTFSVILENIRKRRVLSKVLDIFKIKSNETLDETNERPYFQTVCLQTGGIFTAWKEVADFHLFHSGFSEDDFFLKEWILTSKVYLFEKEERVGREVSLKSDNISPCLIRNLRVDLSADEGFTKNQMNFIQAHGQSVWHLYFRCDLDLTSRISMVEAYKRFCDLLKLLPNLKSLAMLFVPRGIRPANPRWHWDMFQCIFLRNKPHLEIPALNSLQQLYCRDSTDTTLLSQILRTSVNLKCVNCRSQEEATDAVYEVLVPLTLQRYEGLYQIITSNRTNIALVWPLKHLTIHFEYIGPNRRRLGYNWEQPRNASVMFPALNRFSETLQHLCIIGTLVIDDADETVPLNLPLLKSFATFGITNGTMGFDHLLPLKNLEQVIVARLGDEDENAEVKVKRFFESHEMERSNVWERFPNLKRVQLEDGGKWIYRP